MIRYDDYRNNHKLFTLCFVALVLVAKIFFNATLFPYGFYLLNIGLIGYYLFFTKLMTAVSRRYFQTGTERISYVFLVLTFIALFMTSWAESAKIYSNKIIKIDTGKGVVNCFNDERTEAYWSAAQYLKNFTNKDDTLVVFPEGASLNFYAERANPTKYILFYPGDIGKIGEERLIGELRNHKVSYIAILNAVDKDMLSFGEGYGGNLASWIRDNYEKAAQFGTTPFEVNKFWILILKRKDPGLSVVK
jgi:hypothetical protein